MKKIFYFLIISTIIFLGTGCVFEEPDIFNESSAIRLENAKKEYTELLTSNPNGWVMQYFPTDTTEGYNFIMQFLPNTEVKMAAKNKWINNTFTRDSCTFELIADNGPVLTFNTYGANGIFHLFSNPENPLGGTKGEGVGLAGDYEFIVLEGQEDLIRMKGKKRGTYTDFVKLPENVDWQNFFTVTEEMHNRLFVGSPNNLYLISGQDTMVAENGVSQRFNIYNKGGDPILDGEMYPFIMTTQGIKLSSPVEINNSKVQNFIYNSELQQLISNDVSGSAIIEGDNPNIYFVSQIYNSRRWTIDLNSNLSPLMQSKIDVIRSALQAVGRTLVEITFNYDNIYGSPSLLISSRINNRLTNGLLYYSLVGNNEEINYTFITEYDNNGRQYYENFNGVQDLVDSLSSYFRIAAPNKFKQSILKVESVNNPDLWFDVRLR